MSDSNDGSPRSTPFQRRRDAAAENMRRELRQQVRGSDMTQRAIEDANGFSHGYLSQVLQGHVTLTVRHLFGILMALDTPPEDFFRLFFGGSEGPISEIRERMARYDAALKQLEDRGVLSPDSGRIGDESD